MFQDERKQVIKVDVSTVIDAPVGKVWEFMADLDTMPQRDPSVIKVDWQPPLRAGNVAQVTFRNVVLGTRVGRYEVKEWEPNHRFRVRMTTMGAKLNGTYEFESLEGSKTRLTASVEVEVGGLMRIITPFLPYSANRDAKAEFVRIKRVIENIPDMPTG